MFLGALWPWDRKASQSLGVLIGPWGDDSGVKNPAGRAVCSAKPVPAGDPGLDTLLPVTLV